MITQDTPPQRSPLVPIAIAIGLVVVVSAGVVFFVTRSASAAFDPMSSAELAPESTHLFVAFNTDFTSEPWIAMPRLLGAMSIEDDVREDIEESARESGLDYDEDIFPVLAGIRHVAVAAQYTGDDDGEFVVFFDSRDRGRLVEALKPRVEDVISESKETDEALGLEFEIFEERDSESVIAVDNGIVYFSDNTDAISNFIRRQRAEGPLSESPAFVEAMTNVDPNSLLAGFGSGSVLDHRDFRDIVDAIDDSADFDPRDATVTFSFSASSDGFGAQFAMSSLTGFGTLNDFVVAPADIDGLARLTPDDAVFFTAASGLGESMEELLDNLEETVPELIAEWIEPFEEFNDISVRRDIIPALSGDYAFAFGGEDLGADDFDVDSLWALALLESDVPGELEDYLKLVVAEVEFYCECVTDATTSVQPGHAALHWPEEPRLGASLAETESYRRTRALLPSDTSTLYFINLGALSPDAFADLAADAAGADEYEVDYEAILGLAFAGSGSDTSFSFEMVMPIAIEDSE